MDRLIGAGMHKSDSDECGKCGMKKGGGCCKDESKQIKIDNDQKPVSKFVLNIVAVEQILQVYSGQHRTFYFLNDSHIRPLTNGSSDIGVQLYKYLRVFRI
jgi:hypothetical protein